MTEPAISIHNLSKCYKLGSIGRHTLVDEVAYLWHKIRGRDPRQHMGKIGHTATEARRVATEQKGAQEFWALKDVSFDVQPGEVVGIIGRNGAGKSTLLKLLTRITEPTSGEAVINGRVGSLLEVGTGFHPDLTGRENVFMNGTILGMKKCEIDAKFDEIVAFSELEQFIDTPVKRYSSGMYVRLAFAVAAHLEPEILLVDEVLAVGDIQFQKKCLGKMGEVAKTGRTILFVSHNMGMIAQLCHRTLILYEGRVLATGESQAMIERYLEAGDRNKGHQYVRPRASGGEIVGVNCILSAETINAEGLSRGEFPLKDPVYLQLKVRLSNPPPNLMLSMAMRDRLDRKLFSSEESCEALRLGSGHHTVRVRIPGGLLIPGHYRFMLALHIPNRKVVDLADPICHFSIVDTGTPLSRYEGKDIGSFLVNCHWEVLPSTGQVTDPRGTGRVDASAGQ